MTPRGREMIRRIRLIALALSIAVVAVTGSTGAATTSIASPGLPVGQPSASPTAQDVVARLLAARRGLSSYSVPIHFNLVVWKVVRVSAQLDAVRYFQSPDKEILVMKSMPSIAKQFRYIYSAAGTPETWLSRYDVTFAEGQLANSQT